ncbi:MAG: hypothetical protein RR314_01190 [Oscillospiraceae bacterium]
MALILKLLASTEDRLCPGTHIDGLRCSNPRCITTSERELVQLFRLSDGGDGACRCVYCDTRSER